MTASEALRLPVTLLLDGDIDEGFIRGTDYRVAEIESRVKPWLSLRTIETVIRLDPASTVPPAEGDIQRRCWTLYMHPEGNVQCRLFNGHDGEHQW